MFCPGMFLHVAGQAKAMKPLPQKLFGGMSAHVTLPSPNKSETTSSWSTPSVTQVVVVVVELVGVVVAVDVAEVDVEMTEHPSNVGLSSSAAKMMLFSCGGVSAQLTTLSAFGHV